MKNRTPRKFTPAVLVMLLAGLIGVIAVSYTHLRAHETVLDLVCRLLLEKKNIQQERHTHVIDRLHTDTRTSAYY